MKIQEKNIINYLSILIIFIVLCYYTSTYAYEKYIFNEPPKRYFPDVKTLYYPSFPQPSSNVYIYSNVFDKYGKIQNATLFYFVNQTSKHNIKMKLIDGDYSNGKYLGIIPKQTEGSYVYSFVYFEDDLGYFYNGSKSQKVRGEVFFTVTSIDRTPPEFVTSLDPLICPSYVYPEAGKPITFFTYIQDPDKINIKDIKNEGIKNVKLHYHTHKNSTVFHIHFLKDFLRNDKVIPMNLSYSIDHQIVYGCKGIVASASIPAFPENTTILYSIESRDFSDNWAKIPKDREDSTFWSTYEFPINEVPIEYSNLTIHPKLRENSFTINNKVIEPDGQNLTAKITTSFYSNKVNYSNFLTMPDRKFISYNSSLPNGYTSFPLSKIVYDNITVINSDNNKLDNINNIILLSGNIESTVYKNIVKFFSKVNNTNTNNNNNNKYISLFGDPLLFPFDKYYLNLIFFIPINDVTFNLPTIDNNFDKSVIASWDTSTYIQQIDNSNMNCISSNDNILHYLSLYTCNQEKFPLNLLNVNIEFKRNYTSFAIIIPLIAIFFLLGAIFIFENSSDNIGNRLALTLGIFALLFTLPEIIDSMKPQTSAPTIADSMLSIIIIATIAFTISSIISSSSTIQKWFPKHHTWIDGIVFVIVSGFVITYFNKYLFDNQLWWLVPLIIFGLGYGLLLRILGIRINKPLIQFSRGTKEKNM